MGVEDIVEGIGRYFFGDELERVNLALRSYGFPDFRDGLCRLPSGALVTIPERVRIERGTDYIKIDIPNDINLCSIVPDAIAYVFREASNIGIDEVYNPYLCLIEAINNAYEHGNKKDPNKRIKVELSYKGDILEMIVEDQGNGFDCSKVQLPDPKRFRGRGIKTMEERMDTVEYVPPGNRVIMRKRLEQTQKD